MLGSGLTREACQEALNHALCSSWGHAMVCQLLCQAIRREPIDDAVGHALALLTLLRRNLRSWGRYFTHGAAGRSSTAGAVVNSTGCTCITALCHGSAQHLWWWQSLLHLLP